MALAVYSWISHYGFVDERLEIRELGSTCGVVSGGILQFPNGFSGKLFFHLTFNRNFRILAKWQAPKRKLPTSREE